MRTVSSWIQKTLFFVPHMVVPISEPQKSVAWPLRLGSRVQMKPLTGSSCVCWCCLLIVCHLCVSLPFAQCNEVVPFLLPPTPLPLCPTWLLLRRSALRSHSHRHCFQAFVSFLSFRNISWSCFYSFLKRASYLSGIPLLQIFSFHSHILADYNW